MGVGSLLLLRTRSINFQPLVSRRTQDECDKELRSLEKTVTKICERHDPGGTQGWCHTAAKGTIEREAAYFWQRHLASTVLDDGKTPVFWAGFRPGGEEGIDTRKALADFVSSVKGFQLVDTEWGQAAESEGANNLENCTWDRQKSWWKVASASMANAMALHEVPNIIIALHKTLHGNYSFYKTVLYQAELVYMGQEMQKQPTWNPEFEVRSIAVKGSPPNESGCALTSEVKFQLELHAKRWVTVWCKLCTTLQSCGDKKQVEEKEIMGECTEGDCRNGQGTLTYANAHKYQGEFKNGFQDGWGTKTWSNGNIYRGEWKNDKKEGQGTFTWANGNKYQGEFKNGHKEGQGTFTWANGNTYQGEFKNAHQEGQGTFTWTNGDKYQGEYKNGHREGQGTFTWTNGDKYQGEYKNGHPEGQGTYTRANGSKYHGEFKNGFRDGQGILTCASGNKWKVWCKEGHLTGRALVEWRTSGAECWTLKLRHVGRLIRIKVEKIEHRTCCRALGMGRKLHHFCCGCCGHFGRHSKMSRD